MARSVDGKCTRCLKSKAQEALWRCEDCFCLQDMCSTCLRETHQALPFHRIQRWTGQFFQEAWLRDVGLSVFLCQNRNGRPCPSNPGKKLPDNLDEEQLLSSVSAGAPSRPNIIPGVPSILTNFDAELVDPEDPVVPTLDFSAQDEEETEAQLEDEESSDLEDEESNLESEHAGHLPETGQNNNAFIHRGRAAIPQRDLRGFRILLLADTNGIHGIGVGFCKCPSALPEDEQLLLAGLYPATRGVIATAFTIQGLEHSLVDSLECKTTAQQYCRKLQRLTKPDNPKVAPVNTFTLLTKAHA
jgi:hypothetical protein